MVIVRKYTVATTDTSFVITFDDGESHSYTLGNVVIVADTQRDTLLQVASNGFADATTLDWRGCKNLFESTRAATITAMLTLVAEASVSNLFDSLTVTGALSAGSATLGTMTVSSAGALGGTYTLGIQVPVRHLTALPNVSNSAQSTSILSAIGFLNTVARMQYGHTITWRGFSVLPDDETGTFRAVALKNGVAQTIDGGNAFIDVVVSTAGTEFYEEFDTTFTTADGDTLELTLQQTAGTTGSETAVTLWGDISF